MDIPHRGPFLQLDMVQATAEASTSVIAGVSEYVGAEGFEPPGLFLVREVMLRQGSLEQALTWAEADTVDWVGLVRFAPPYSLEPGQQSTTAKVRPGSISSAARDR